MGGFCSAPRADSLILAFNGRDGSQEHIKLSQSLRAHMGIQFNEHGATVMVEHGGKDYRFQTVATQNPDDFEQLHEKNGVFIYHHHTEVNGLQQLTTRLYSILNPDFGLWVNFGEPATPPQNIITLCSFENIFRAYTIIISKERTSNEELNFIRARFPVLEALNFQTICPLWMSFPLSYPHAIVKTGTSLSALDLATMNCATLIMPDTSITPKDLNSLIHHWIEHPEPGALMNLEITNFEGSMDLWQGLDQQEVEGAYKFRRHDGKRGKVSWIGGKFKFEVLKN